MVRHYFTTEGMRPADIAGPLTLFVVGVFIMAVSIIQQNAIRAAASPAGIAAMNERATSAQRHEQDAVGGSQTEVLFEIVEPASSCSVPGPTLECMPPHDANADQGVNK